MKDYKITPFALRAPSQGKRSVGTFPKEEYASSRFRGVYILFAGLWLLGLTALGQVPPPVTVVKAPTLEALAIREEGMLASMNITLATIEEVEQKMERIQEVTDWLEKMESMQEFIELLETTACLARDLDVDMRIAMDLVGKRSSCFSEFSYKVNINQLRYVVDVINVVLTDGFNMSRAGRLEAYQNALEAFEKAQLGLGNLMVTLKRIIHRYERAKEYKEELMISNAF